MKIFPITLSGSLAYSLCHKHFASEAKKEIERLWGDSTLDYSAYLQESGEVDLYVRYHSDNGFALSSGCLLSKTFKPFNDDEIIQIVKKEKFALAKEEFLKREDIRIREEILKIHNEMFGEQS